MSTHAFIAIQLSEELVEGIYCHFDGYPEAVGRMLLRFYDLKKTKELLALGNISYLDVELYPTTTTHSFETPEEGVVVAYGRDRGETNTKSMKCRPSMIDAPYAVDWIYLIDEEGTWFVRHCSEKKFIPLLSVLSKRAN